MNTTQNLTVRIETQLKNEVKSILAELGFDQSQAVVAFFKEIARTKKIPLSFDLNDNWRQPTKFEKEIIEDYEDRKAKGIAKTISLEDFKKRVEN